MHEVVESRRAEIQALCRRLAVRRLDVFGSVVRDDFDVESSDVDVLVEFEVSPQLDRFGTYFDLKEGLERIFGRPVDVVTVPSIRNPYFREHVMCTRQTVYASSCSEGQAGAVGGGAWGALGYGDGTVYQGAGGAGLFAVPAYPFGEEALELDGDRVVRVPVVVDQG